MTEWQVLPAHWLTSEVRCREGMKTRNCVGSTAQDAVAKQGHRYGAGGFSPILPEVQIHLRDSF